MLLHNQVIYSVPKFRSFFLFKEQMLTVYFITLPLKYLISVLL